ncbi:MAG: InlB B-repeat-containing protein, partial [Oscillospiraceae bacterium]|nr:InlB B-repeat-containing protein [Oscillospiraceae bacterium]
MRKHSFWKRTAAGILAVCLVFGSVPMTGIGGGGLFSRTAITARATEDSETFDTNTYDSTYTGTHFKIDVTDIGDSDGFDLNSDGSETATITALNNENITKIELVRGFNTGEPSVSSVTAVKSKDGETFTFSNINATSVTINGCTGAKYCQIKQVKIYYEEGITRPIAKTGLITTGSAQELVTAGSASEGEMQYALGTDAVTAPTAGYSTKIPTGTDAGKYYVWYKVVNGDQESAAACLTVLIDKSYYLSDEAIDKVLESIKGTSISLVMIGTKGGAVLGGLPESTANVTVRWDNEANKTAVMVLYDNDKKQTKDQIKEMLQKICYQDSTTHVHIDVATGDTTDDILTQIKNTTQVTFGVQNADGEAHAYKYMSGLSKNWIQVYDEANKGTATLGGLKGYLATVTTTGEAEMLKQFYQTNAGGSGNGAWIAATALHYSTADGATYDTAGQISPSNYSSNTSTGYFNKSTGQIESSTYRDDFYWASGPELGQKVDSSLWANGEPNSSDGGRGGEDCAVSPWNGGTLFNDFSWKRTDVAAYFLEFSVYDGGKVEDSGTEINPETIFRIKYDANGASGDAPAASDKLVGKNRVLADAGDMTYKGMAFKGWNTKADGTGTAYKAGAEYSLDAPVTLYAQWGYEVTANKELAYDENAHALVTVDPKKAELQFAVTDTDQDTSGTAEWAATIPERTDAGTYRVWYKLNETGTTEGYVDVTIARINPTIKAPTPKTGLIAGETAQALIEAAGTTNGGDLQYAVTTEDTAPTDASAWKTDIADITGTAAGSYYIWYKADANTNYNAVEATRAGEVTITKAAIKPAVTIKGWTYGDKANTPTVTGAPEG